MLFSRALLLQYDKFQFRFIGPQLRKLGQRMYKLGASLQGDLFHEDRLVPSMRCVPTSKTVFPKLLPSEWIAPNCTVIGNVETQKFSSLYHGVILRGDSCKITIGKGSIIQDNTILHNSNSQTKSTAEIRIGDNVVIGVNCRINACVIEDNVLVGNGATIHEGCHIETGAMVAPGAVILPNTTVPANQIWAGNPAKYLRDIKASEKVNIGEHRNELQELASVCAEETEKSTVEILNDEDYRMTLWFTSQEDIYLSELAQFGNFTNGATDDFGIEGNLEGYDDYEQEDLMRFTAGRGFMDENMDLNYEQNLSNYPDIFKVYGENYEKYEKLRQKFEREEGPRESPEFPRSYHMPERPEAMRQWLNKWDPQFNTTFKQVGGQGENPNN